MQCLRTLDEVSLKFLSNMFFSVLEGKKGGGGGGGKGDSIRLAHRPCC